MKRLIVIISILCISIGYAQSPWTQADGEFYGQLSFNMIPEYEELYTKNGTNLLTERKLQDFTLQGWLEWGISESSTILFSFPLKMLKSGDLVTADQPDPFTDSGSITAPGNLRIGWKQGLFKDNLVAAGQLWLEMPTAKYDDESGLRSGYDAWAIIPSFNLGTSGTSWYSYANIAYGYRNNDYSHFTQLMAEAGYHFSQKISAAIYFDWLNSLNNGSRIDPVNNLITGLYVNNQEYLAWGLKVFGRILGEKTGISLGIAGAFSGNYVARAPAINLALYHQF